MSFSNIKMLNESFTVKDKTPDHTYISEIELDRKINECKNKLISIKERYEELKSSWRSLCEDAEALSLGKHLSGDGMLSESFNKAIEDLKLDYRDTKATLQAYKDMKNNTLLEAEIRLSPDQLMDPSSMPKFREIAKEADDAEKERIANKARYDKIAELESKAPDIIRAVEDSDDPFETAFDLLVPESGKCETLAGEMIRAMMRLLYRDYNDGDLFYESYGLEVAAPAASFLMEHGYWDQFEEIMNKELRDDQYTQALEAIKDKLVDDILDLEFLATINEEDMLRSDTSYIEENQPRYDYELYASDDLIEHIEAGHCDSWKLKDYVEEALSWESDTRDAEVETPWSHYDTSVTVNNLTKDGLERLEDIFRNNGASRFWEELVNELNEEFPDEDDEEADYEDSEDEDLDEALTIIPENKLEESKFDNLTRAFLDLWDRAKNSPIASRIKNILGAYGSSDTVAETFSAASENDKMRMIELASIAIK